MVQQPPATAGFLLLSSVRPLPGSTADLRYGLLPEVMRRWPDWSGLGPDQSEPSSPLMHTGQRAAATVRECQSCPDWQFECRGLMHHFLHLSGGYCTIFFICPGLIQQLAAEIPPIFRYRGCCTIFVVCPGAVAPFFSFVRG